MKNALKETIKVLAKNSKDAKTSIEALQYTQAALNAAKALEVVTEVERK
jgi:hypothetical protein